MLVKVFVKVHVFVLNIWRMLGQSVQAELVCLRCFEAHTQEAVTWDDKDAMTVLRLWGLRPHHLQLEENGYRTFKVPLHVQDPSFFDFSARRKI